MRNCYRSLALTDTDEYGLPNQPKYDHLTTLHSYLNRFGSIIVASDPVYVSYCALRSFLASLTVCIASTSESHTYGTGANAVAFLSNIDTESATNITYGGVTFTIPPWSVTIVYAGQVLYNTATLPYTEPRPRLMKPINALGPNSGAIWCASLLPLVAADLKRLGAGLLSRLECGAVPSTILRPLSK